MYKINIEENIIDMDTCIVDAMRHLDMVSPKILFVVNDRKQLIASLTDGDIRRAIISGSELTASVVQAANKDCIFVYDDDAERIIQVANQEKLRVIPIINHDNEIIRLYCNEEIDVKRDIDAIDVPVVIMAGGFGKRLYPYTKVLPKALIPVNEIPISDRIIESFTNIGCSKFHMVVNYKKGMIKAYYQDEEVVERLGVRINFVDEDIPLGTGGGIKLLQNTITDTFIVTNCDILILENVAEIVKHHKEQNNSITMVCSLKNYVVPYGVVNFSEGGEIMSFEEKPRMSFFTNTGYYVIEPSIMNYINDNESISMPEIIDRMRVDGKKVGIYPIGENSWLDMGQFDSMEGMESQLNAQGKNS